jgi:uncharacterized protein
VREVLSLLDEGATVPFVARYRKERTGGLDEVAIRQIAESATGIRELTARRDTIVAAIEQQGKMTPKLRSELERASTKVELEDLYAPYKQRRKTRADTARALGLEPLAKRILEQPGQGDPVREAARFVRGDVGSPEEALSGARDIVAETLALDADRRGLVRDITRNHGAVSSAKKRGATEVDKFKNYLDYQEPVRRIASHRYLAVCRGEAEGALAVKVRPEVDKLLFDVRSTVRSGRSAYAEQLALAVEDATRRILVPAAERAIRGELKEWADDQAIDVFQRNLEALLLGAPFGARSVFGIDPGIRTGCKCAMVSATGDLVAHETVYLVGRSKPQIAELTRALRRHRPDAVAVGNGTGGRESETLVRQVVRDEGLGVVVVQVNEAGASVYSASDVAREELGEVDLTVRGAVSIARRLQDPLAELVKVDAASLGVGQYQHDVDQAKLTRRLSQVVESCVNRVGVVLNTASAPLLAHVAGIGPKVARAIVEHRRSNGPFSTRKDLLAVKGLGRKTFEQAAGFLRIPGGPQPLDASAVHPERYALVGQMARDARCSVADLVGGGRAGRIALDTYVSDGVGLATLRDIVAELDKPGRDPRKRFEAPAFRDDVREIGDLKEGMVLEGVVTNVTNFGAFVDVGVHCDGLVHVSQLADGFVQDVHSVVQAGQRVAVRVLQVDVPRKRISLGRKGLDQP